MEDQARDTGDEGNDNLDASCPDVNIFKRNKKNALSPEEDKSGPQGPIPHHTTNVYNNSDLYYNMKGNKYLYIFNHYKFQRREDGSKPTDRNGTFEDVKRLQNTFTQLGFQVKAHQDLNHEAIIDALHGIITLDHQKTCCVAVAVLTHGDAGGVLEAADMQYSLSEIHDRFVYSHNLHLSHKPKLFFIQACRGYKLDSGVLATDGLRSPHDYITLPSHADILTLYSTSPDYISWRESKGSWLIQALCNAVDSYSKDLDILHIITIVNAEVAKRSSNNLKKLLHDKKQASETHYTLTKLLKF